MTAFPALGTTVHVLTTEGAHAAAATDAVRAVVDRIDRACSRFRDDSELAAVNRGAGRAVACSPTLRDAVSVALRAAAATDGIVVPVLGEVLRRLGYDRSFAEVAADGGPLRVEVTAVAAWKAVVVDDRAGTVTVPAGASLDLGATAKAWCADLAAREAAGRVGGGVLVSLGGDIACAGPAPPGGWPVRLADDQAAAPDEPGPGITVAGGGLATSGVTVRRWRRGGVELHHLIDPRTGRPAPVVWRTVSVTAATCVDANTASTAAVILGREAPAWLERRHLPARLVAVDGAVTTCGGWPRD